MRDQKRDGRPKTLADRAKELAERRIENYSARLNVGQCGAPVRSALKGMAERHAAAMVRVKRVRAQTEAFLDELDVPKVDWPAYWGYACKLEKIKDNVLGEQTLREEVAILALMGESRGLSRSVMMRIARELFELELGEAKPVSTNQE